MGNPYATENWLRKQCRLRDERIRDLEIALRAAQAFLREVGDATSAAAAHDLIVNHVEDVEDTVSAALQPTPKDIVAC